MKKRPAYPLLDLLKKLKPTRENYLAIDRWEPNPELTGEEETLLPPQFRAKDETEKPLTSEEAARQIHVAWVFDLESC